MTDSLQDLTEDVDFDAKLAAGRDGHGAVPESSWETYAAFANTNGGVVLLGVEDKANVLRAVGVKNSQGTRGRKPRLQRRTGGFQQSAARLHQNARSSQQSDLGRSDTAGGVKPRPLMGRRASLARVAWASREFCRVPWLTATEIADALGGTQQSARNHSLPVLVAGRTLELRCADRVNDPRQAYWTADSSREEGEQ